MTSPAYAPGAAYNAEEYQRAKESLKDPSLPAEKRAMRMARIAEFEKSQAEEDQARGYRPSSTLEPAKEELVQKLRKAMKDDTLTNESGLKVFGGQAEFEPPVMRNPFSAMSPMVSAKPKIWHEPSVKDFRAALEADGVLHEKTAKELGAGAYGDSTETVKPRGPNEHAAPLVKDITTLGNRPLDPRQLDDETLERSEAFKAYRDAAWQHALADSIKSRTPIYRLKHTKKLSDVEKMGEEALDTGGAVVGGLGQSATFGLLDPLKRSINPQLAAEDRQQRNRHPSAEMVGEVGGAFLGGPELVARGSAKLLGRRLGGSSAGRAATSAGAGAITSATDAQLRAIAQSAADALDARDSVEDTARKIYDALSLQTSLGGAATGAGAGLLGHAVGSALNSGARKLVTSGEGAEGRAATIKQNLDTGGKMDWKGQIKTEPEIDNLIQEAPYDMPADEVLARKAAKPMLKQRRLEQEAAKREADEVTAAARERLNGQTVPVEDTAERLENYASSLPDDSAASEVRKLARKLKKASILSPEELDAYIDLMDQKAGYDSGRKLDKKRQHYVEAGRILREDRDSLRFEDQTNPGGFAHRDSRGNVSANTDYSAVKTELSAKQHAQNEENKLLGLPDDIPVAPQRIPSAPDDISRQALAEGTEPNVQLPLEHEKAFLQSLQGAGKPGRGMETKAQQRLAERSGVSKEYGLIKKMRARQDYRKLLAQAMNGVSIGSGGVGNKFFSTNQLLRTVPTLKSFGGGLPKLEATDELVNLLDRHLSEQSGQGRASMADRIMDEMVPEAKALNLRGGQPTKLLGATRRDEKGDEAKLTPEESALARALIRELMKMETGQ